MINVSYKKGEGMLKRTMTGVAVLSIALLMGGCSFTDDIINNIKEEVADNDELVTATEFTQSLISANPWYWTGSDEGGEVWCSGTFVFDGNNNLAVSWKEGGETESVSVPYLLAEGKLTIEHDEQVDTHTLLSAESDRLLVESEQAKPTGTVTADYIWFVNKADAEAYLAEHGVESCYL